MTNGLDALCVNTIRTLAMDAVQKANSGHPGLPMGAAHIGYVLWTRHLRHNPAHPDWVARDRFILSPGHGCMLLYSLLHLTGYDLPLEELKQFRQWGSRTPGHSEYGHTVGVETTTGPLGQGFANGVGMAIAQKYLASYFNRDGFEVMDYSIYALTSDGELMEGVDSEAASLAGHLGLGNLVYLYDDNHISIDGGTDLTFTENVATRFESYGWHVQELGDTASLQVISDAIDAAKSEKDRPSLIKVRTHIGWGSPNKQDSASAHGSPLGEEEIRLTKKAWGLDPEKSFFIPDEALAEFRKCVERGKRMEADWQTLWSAYEKKYPKLAAEFKNWEARELPKDWEKALPDFVGEKPMATRKASGVVLNAIAGKLPMLLGGSADLTPSTNTWLMDSPDFQKGRFNGRNFHFGVREHGMAAAVNGMALSKMLIPYGASFLVFTDYARPSIRLAALMKIQSVFVFTHDSIGLGEDGPTHQPIEHLSSLRAIPGLTVFRPADATETAIGWRFAIEHRDGPTMLVLTRQNLPVLDRSRFPSAESALKGGYVLVGADETPDLILLASGSEVSLALESAEKLQSDGVKVRVVNMPSFELFDKQPVAYRESVLPPGVRRRLAIEAAHPMSWHKYVGLDGDVVGMGTFGASAPAEVLFEKFGFTVENIIKRAKKLLN